MIRASGFRRTIRAMAASVLSLSTWGARRPWRGEPARPRHAYNVGTAGRTSTSGERTFGGSDAGGLCPVDCVAFSADTIASAARRLEEALGWNAIRVRAFLESDGLVLCGCEHGADSRTLRRGERRAAALMWMGID